MAPGLGREEALAVLGLAAGAVLTEGELRRQYRRLALEHHPDKVKGRGGDASAATVRFQRIAEAHALLAKSLLAPAPAPRPAAPVLPRVRRPPAASSLPTDAAAGDSGGSTSYCSFCHKSAFVINRARAEPLGINWVEHEAHPDRLRTCLLCKMAQRSVLSEDQALEKMPQLRARRGVFAELRFEGRSFGVNGEAHYWVPDLQARVRTPEAAEVGLETPERPSRPWREDEGPKAKRPRTSQEPTTPESGGCAEAKEGPWWYRVCGDRKLGIRKAADVDAPASPAGHLPAGAAFAVSVRILGPDGRTYLKLADGRGWTYDLSAKDVTKRVVEAISAQEAAKAQQEASKNAVEEQKEKKEKKEKKLKKEKREKR